MTDPADQSKQLAAQVAELRAQVAQLQAAIKQAGIDKKVTAKPGMPMGTAGNKPMGMMDDMKEMGMPAGRGAMTSAPAPMGMKDDDEGEMGAMSPAGSAPAAAMGMCCMGEMGAMPPAGNAAMSAKPAAAGGMASMSGPSSAMPGQAGASHLYHVGSTGFFLNHPRHITLTADQKLGLNRLKEKAMLDRASGQRQIDQAEQELYSLTGADQIDNAKVQAKIGEIEKQRAEQRMNFIRAVGEASNVLTNDQRQALTGTMAAAKK
jgi:Spy/CpxP family protein refolding chaperone